VRNVLTPVEIARENLQAERPVATRSFPSANGASVIFLLFYLEPSADVTFILSKMS